MAFAVSAVVTSTKVRCPSRFSSEPRYTARQPSSERGETVRNSFEYSTALYDLPRDLSRKVVSYGGKVVATHCYGPGHRKSEYAKAKILDGRRSTVTTSAFRSAREKRTLEAPSFLVAYAIGKRKDRYSIPSTTRGGAP